MKALRDGAAGGVSKFFLIGFMALAVGGLVMMDVGGVFRGGVASTDVAQIGDETISINSFDRTLRRNLSAVGLSPQEAYELGYITQVLSAEIRAVLLKKSAQDYGIVISDEKAAAHIKDLLRPMVQTGQDPKNVLSQLLRAQGMREGEFVQAIKRDIGNGILLDALNSNFEVLSDSMAQALYKRANETRAIEYVSFMDDDITEIEEPDEEVLKQLYLGTRETYAREETRVLKVITIDTASLRETLSISDEDIKQFYQDNKAFYDVAATWTIDQAIVSDEKQAKDIYEAAQKGAPLEEAVEDITKNKAGYLGARESVLDDILDVLKEPVQSAQEDGTLIPPIKSPLGWHVLRINSINEARTKSLDEVREDIKREIAETQLIDQMYDLANDMDDMLAGGATIEEVGESIDLIIKTTPPVNQYGLTEKGTDGFSDFGQSKDRIVETALTLGEGETSAIFETMDGQFMAVQVAAYNPKSYRSFEEVKPALRTRWINDQKRQKNRARARQELSYAKPLNIVAQNNGKTIEQQNKLMREGAPPAPFAPFSIARIFESPLNEIVMVDILGGVALVKVTDFSWPDVDTESIEYRSFKAELVNENKNEFLSAYLRTQEQEYNAMVNNRLLQQAYGPQDVNY